MSFGLLTVKAKISFILRSKGLGWREGRSRGEGNRGQADLLFHVKGPAGSIDNLTTSESCLLHYPFQKPSLLSRGGKLLRQLLSRLGYVVRNNFDAVRLEL